MRLGLIFAKSKQETASVLYYPLLYTFSKKHCPYLGRPIVNDCPAMRKWKVAPVASVIHRIHLLPLAGSWIPDHSFLIAGPIKRSFFFAPFEQHLLSEEERVPTPEGGYVFPFSLIVIAYSTIPKIIQPSTHSNQQVSTILVRQLKHIADNGAVATKEYEIR